LLQYELLVQNPEAQFQELCDFLEIEYNYSLIENIFTSSVKKNPPPQIDVDIRDACLTMYKKLCSEMGTKL
jgi:hypothetical protein